RYEFEAIAVGNGTGGRESEAFCRTIDFGKKIPVIMVNESGASVYSASEIAREEFPDHDITVRGAVSIGRRLMDPLAELVKIDPKSIGVGQYQHDVDQKMLKSALDDTVRSCVNAVGVELNTASARVLSYVSGCNNKIANNIVSFRDLNGPYSSRTELKKVKGLGPKVYEQAAGFLRISKGKNILDGSAVHPESYNTVKMMAVDNNCTVEDLMKDDALRKRIKLEKYVSDNVGLPTLKDIVDELAQPGRDPRNSFEVFSFDDTVSTPEDL
ncbi:MAG: RNA-binding transcriptional accessory protein, partial [Proteobacteria bacterium]|nr:RNA-binding transcriptional accessory protein [Pseudomonadota bacterium]